MCTALIIHSCKKNSADRNGENNLSQNINQAKAWYENTYPVNSKYSVNRSVVRTGNSNLNSNPQLNTGFDYSKFIKPDWKHAASYARFNAGVLELPIDPSSSAISTALSISPHGNALYNPKYSRSSFLILNDSTGYHAYIMTLIADSAYINNDLSILGRNKYNERDVHFSGVVLYSTPDGSYVNGWIYKNGNIVLALPPGQKRNNGAAVNKNTAVTQSAAKTSRFRNHTLLLAIETCYTWYQTTTVNGVTSDPIVLDETCYTTYIDDTGGSSGSSGSTGVSGSTGSTGSSGGSAPAPAPIPPCIVPAASTNAAALAGKHSMIRVVQTTGSGFPAPTSTTITTPCPTTKPTPVVLNIKTDSLTKHFPCATALIVNNLTECGVYSTLVQAFTTSRRPDLIWQDGNLPWNAPISNSTATTYQLGLTQAESTGLGQGATITLNTKMLQNSSMLLIEATAIHETLHAYINYNVATAVDNKQQGYVTTGSWLYSIDSWININGLPSNYSNHYVMLSNYFSMAVNSLAQLDNNAHTAKDYEMAMLYGLNNATDGTIAQQALLNTEFNSLLSQYGITAADLNTFNQNNLNATSNKLPTSGCPTI
ncbi:MAG: hypothetical protein ACHQIM_18615 [Sphingobacteriales bacterium]